MPFFFIFAQFFGFTLPAEGPFADYGRCIRTEAAQALARQLPEIIKSEKILDACASQRREAIERAAIALPRNSELTKLSPPERSRQVGLLADLAAGSVINELVRQRFEERAEAAAQAERAKRLGDTSIYCTAHPSNWSVRLDSRDAVTRNGDFMTEEISRLTLDGKLVEIRTGTAQRPYRAEKQGGEIVQQYFGPSLDGSQYETASLKIFKESGSTEYRIVDAGNNYHYWYFIITSQHFRGPDGDDWFFARLKPFETFDDCMKADD